jgi:hypothetical protein
MTTTTKPNNVRPFWPEADRTIPAADLEHGDLFINPWTGEPARFVSGSHYGRSGGREPFALLETTSGRRFISNLDPAAFVNVVTS